MTALRPLRKATELDSRRACISGKIMRFTDIVRCDRKMTCLVQHWIFFRWKEPACVTHKQVLQDSTSRFRKLPINGRRPSDATGNNCHNSSQDNSNDGTGIVVISISRIVRIAAVIGPVICRSKMLVFLRNVCFLVPRKRELGEPGTEIGLYTSCETAPLPKECSRRLRCSDPAGGRDRLDCWGVT